MNRLEVLQKIQGGWIGEVTVAVKKYEKLNKKKDGKEESQQGFRIWVLRIIKYKDSKNQKIVQEREVCFRYVKFHMLIGCLKVNVW